MRNELFKWGKASFHPLHLQHDLQLRKELADVLSYDENPKNPDFEHEPDIKPTLKDVQKICPSLHIAYVNNVIRFCDGI